MKKIIIRPSDLGLKDLEIFYHPELFASDETDIQACNSFLAKTIITGALLASLNSNAYEKVQINNPVSQTSLVVDVVNSIDLIEGDYIEEYNYLTSKNNFKCFTSDELDEMELLDAYYLQTKRFYPAKNKIAF